MEKDDKPKTEREYILSMRKTIEDAMYSKVSKEGDRHTGESITVDLENGKAVLSRHFDSLKNNIYTLEIYIFDREGKELLKQGEVREISTPLRLGELYANLEENFKLGAARSGPRPPMKLCDQD